MGRDYIIHTPEEIAHIRVAAAMAGRPDMNFLIAE